MHKAVKKITRADTHNEDDQFYHSLRLQVLARSGLHTVRNWAIMDLFQEDLRIAAPCATSKPLWSILRSK